jgi:plasmid stability protein
MAQVLVRGLDEATLKRLHRRARANGRSLEAELRGILQSAATDVDEIRALAAKLRQRLQGRRHTDAVALVAADRAR